MLARLFILMLALSAGTAAVAGVEYQTIPTPLRAAYQARHPDNCVLFLRNDMGIRLPTGLTTWAQKRAIINVRGAPRVGDVAMIEVPSGSAAAYGHVAQVRDVTPTSITVLEANFRAGRVTQRRATGRDLEDAQRQLRIAGYYRP